jgi:hypothetical protein
MTGFYHRVNTEKTLASQALARGGAPDPNSLKRLKKIGVASARALCDKNVTRQTTTILKRKNKMKMAEKIARIQELINGNGGVNYIKIRLFMEDVDLGIEAEKQGCLTLENHVDSLIRVLEHVVAQPFD